MDRLFSERWRERVRIARDLHDNPLENITGFALQVDALSKTVIEPKQAKDHLRELRREAEQWLKEARESVAPLWN